MIHIVHSWKRTSSNLAKKSTYKVRFFKKGTLNLVHWEKSQSFNKYSERVSSNRKLPRSKMGSHKKYALHMTKYVGQVAFLQLDAKSIVLGFSFVSLNGIHV